MKLKDFFRQRLPVMVADFLIGGFIGWVYETVLTSIVWGRFAQRGVLHIPLLPIYGIFALGSSFFYRKEHNTVFVFVTGTIAATILEIIGAYLTEFFLHERLWDYSAWKFNFLGGRISLFSSLIFGAMCVLFVKIIHPLTVKALKR